MSVPIPIEIIKHKNAEGHLLSASASWPEFYAERFGYALLACFIASACSYGIVNDMIEGQVRDHRGAFNFLVVLVGVIGMSCWIMRDTICKRRVVTFDGDGDIQTPRGFPGNEDHGRMSHSHKQIASIETRRTRENQWIVIVYMRDGEAYWLTQYHDELDAHKVAVTLTNLLQDIRQAMASRPGNNSAASIDECVQEAKARAKRGGSVHAVID